MMWKLAVGLVIIWTLMGLLLYGADRWAHRKGAPPDEE